jgi:type II restriction enzyme
MHVLSAASDIDDLEAALGIELLRGWASVGGDVPPTETEDVCVERRLQAIVDALDDFPATEVVAKQARSTLIACSRDFLGSLLDEQLLECMQTEFELFRRIERKVCTPQTSMVFKSIDQFIKTANSILQRRKARAGLSLENQVHALLEAARVPHEMKPVVDGTRPDIVIPGAKEYVDTAWPISKLFVVGVKRTCKDRWRQVLREAPRVDRKHLLTIQNGISASQMEEIKQAGVELIVPRNLHSFFPKRRRSELRTLDGFVTEVTRALAR